MELKATYRPSELIAGPELEPLACAWVPEILIRFVLPVCRSRTNTSVARFVSPGTSFEASEAKATYRPFGVTAGWYGLLLFDCASELETLLRFVKTLAAAARPLPAASASAATKTA